VKALSDNELVEKYKAGCDEAAGILFTRHYSKMFAYVVLRTKCAQDTEDIVHDSFIIVLNAIKRGKYKEQTKFAGWLMRITHNQMINLFRKRKYQNTMYFNDDIAEDHLTFLEDKKEVYPTKMTLKKLELLLAKLIPEQREVVIKRYWQEMTYQDISKDQEVSVNTSLGRNRHALIRLRKLIKKYNIELEFDHE
jgi:RNA polymerase sigma factor (sigma-70 family)